MISRISKLLSKGILNILLSILFLIMMVAVALYLMYVFLVLFFSFKRYIKYYEMPNRLCFYYDKVSNIHIVYRPNKKAIIHDDTSRTRSVIEICDYISDREENFFILSNHLYSFNTLPKEVQYSIIKYNSKLYKELTKQ